MVLQYVRIPTGQSPCNYTFFSSENTHFSVSFLDVNFLLSILPNHTLSFGIVNDSSVNDDRMFSLQLAPAAADLNFNLTVPEARVIIEDDDGIGI